MGRRWIAGILFGLLSGSPCFSQSVVGTTTAPDGLWSASHFYVHCAAGRYWVAYHDGTQPVIKSSADGSNWTALGNIFSLGGASLTYTWSVRYLGTTIIAVRYLAGTNTRYYRNGTLNPDGSIAWAAADLASGPTGSSWEYSSALIANGKPIYWRSDTGNSSQGRFRIGTQINSPSFYATSGDAVPRHGNRRAVLLRCRIPSRRKRPGRSHRLARHDRDGLRRGKPSPGRDQVRCESRYRPLRGLLVQRLDVERRPHRRRDDGGEGSDGRRRTPALLSFARQQRAHPCRLRQS